MRIQKVRSMSSLLDASDESGFYSASVAPSLWSWRNWSRRRGDGMLSTLALTSILSAGVVLGFTLPASDDLHGPYRRISAVIGWTYFCR